MQLPYLFHVLHWAYVKIKKMLSRLKNIINRESGSIFIIAQAQRWLAESGLPSVHPDFIIDKVNAHASATSLSPSLSSQEGQSSIIIISSSSSSSHLSDTPTA